MDYDLLALQVRSLLESESDPLANAATFAAFVYAELPQVNWAGFYFARPGGELVLGPFCGKPACTRLPAGRGVCGAAAAAAATVVVEDVAAFADHIVCDAASASEIVVPILHEGRTVAVFDVDAPVRARFGEADRDGIERLVGIAARPVLQLAEALAASPATNGAHDSNGIGSAK